MRRRSFQGFVSMVCSLGFEKLDDIRVDIVTTTPAFPALMASSRACISYGCADVLLMDSVSDLIQHEANEKLELVS
ncbi:hypothetical protein PanWU01x14_266990 [Parasponia andersonii]|uniref:Uncharacterized protein n=1 Tax=Parasponia andersonii TaxID=3476 RepID=A0A2P5B6P5_PARAD|nr:hypothetical protein PanWU01x14_266990 [Parasponia andersonii]